MQGRQITEDMYRRALNSFREDPGNILAAARAAGVARATAKKLWQGPISPHMGPWARPCREVIQEEIQAADQQKLARDAEERRLAAEELERRRRLEEEAARIEESALRLGRNNLLGGMGLLATMMPGLKEMVKRVNTQLERGTVTNAAGQTVALEMDPAKALGILSKFATASRDMTFVARQLIDLHRLQEGLPTAIVGVREDMTLDEAEGIMATARQAIERARRQSAMAEAAEPGAPLPLPLSGDDTDEDDEDDDGPSGTPLLFDHDDDAPAPGVPT